jgi:hypothetical protein
MSITGRSVSALEQKMERKLKDITKDWVEGHPDYITRKATQRPYKPRLMRKKP